MIIQFKNRFRELSELREVLNSDKFEFIIIYGRRRVGKTELILKATENTRRFYFLATEKDNLRRFYESCLNYSKDFEHVKMSWEAIFNTLKNKTSVIIIDEFQNMIKEDKSILSTFQLIIDTILKQTRIKLFLLGSSISIITSETLSYKSPLYGRRTGSFLLKPVKFKDLTHFFKTSVEELIKIYSFADGIPHYLNMIKPPFTKWLNEKLHKRRSFIKDEIDFLTRYEFEDPSTYKLILKAIALGKTKVSEIRDYLNLKRTDLSQYLRNLINVGMIKREVPITESIKSKQGRYYIIDNFLNFWFRFIFPNLSLVEEGVFTLNTTEFNQYLGLVFEKVCKEFLLNTRIINYTRIGKQWGKFKGEKGKNTYEIDIIALNENTKEILFSECKWKNRVNAERIIRDLVRKAEHVNWFNKERKEEFCVFAKSFSKKITEFNGKKTHCFDLKDIERMLKKTR